MSLCYDPFTLLWFNHYYNCCRSFTVVNTDTATSIAAAPLSQIEEKDKGSSSSADDA